MQAGLSRDPAHQGPWSDGKPRPIRDMLEGHDTLLRSILIDIAATGQGVVSPKFEIHRVIAYPIIR